MSISIEQATAARRAIDQARANGQIGVANATAAGQYMSEQERRKAAEQQALMEAASKFGNLFGTMFQTSAGAGAKNLESYMKPQAEAFTSYMTGLQGLGQAAGAGNVAGMNALGKLGDAASAVSVGHGQDLASLGKNTVDMNKSYMESLGVLGGLATKLGTEGLQSLGPVAGKPLLPNGQPYTPPPAGAPGAALIPPEDQYMRKAVEGPEGGFKPTPGYTNYNYAGQMYQIPMGRTPGALNALAGQMREGNASGSSDLRGVGDRMDAGSKQGLDALAGLADRIPGAMSQSNQTVTGLADKMGSGYSGFQGSSREAMDTSNKTLNDQYQQSMREMQEWWKSSFGKNEAFQTPLERAQQQAAAEDFRKQRVNQSVVDKDELRKQNYIKYHQDQADREARVQADHQARVEWWNKMTPKQRKLAMNTVRFSSDSPGRKVDLLRGQTW